jgi:hypothetical protein
MQDKFDKDQNQANYLSNKLSEAELRIDERERKVSEYISELSRLRPELEIVRAGLK